MSNGLRFHSISQSLGTSFSWFVPSADMPVEQNTRGYDVYRDELTTPRGNTWLYDKGKRRTWTLDWQMVTTDTKMKCEHIFCGWLGSRQICVVAYGSSVIGTTESMASMASVGQIWATCFVKMSKPKESVFDLWDFTMDLIEFGQDQSFT